jgi:hypothetical protein
MRHLVLLPICKEAKAAEAEDHHRPCGGFGNGGCNVGDPRFGLARRVDAVTRNRCTIS